MTLTFGFFGAGFFFGFGAGFLFGFGFLPQPVPQALIPQKWRYCLGAPTILMKLP
jgi:hypothetical protein